MRILVVGTGYVGLVTGTCFAEMGHHVTCLDIDEKKIKSLKEKKVPFYEPGLEELVGRNYDKGRLRFTTSYEEGLCGAKVTFLAVPTPTGFQGRADLSYLESAVRSLASHLKRSHLIVNKSTAPVGTLFHLQALLKKEYPQLECDFASNPEFLKEGDAIGDFMKPDRIVLGVDKAPVGVLLKELYAPFSLSSDRILLMDIASAEMTKYAANAMLASRISFMNEISGLCEKLGADVSMVRKGVGSDQRIGTKFLYPGIGYGGSCFPKDIAALLALSQDLNYPMPILNAIEGVNEKQKRILFEKATHHFEGFLKNKVFAIWGLSFKPNTDDIRKAPALELIQLFLQSGVTLRLFDPIAMEKAKEELSGLPVIFCESEQETVIGADAIFLVTEWKQFRLIDFKPLLETMRGNTFFDGRNQYSPKEMASLGFDYISIGRSPHYADTNPSFSSTRCETSDPLPSF